MNPLEANAHQQVVERVEELAEQFRSAQPFRHVVIDKFFTPELCRRLSENFAPFDERMATNQDGEVGNKAVR